MTTLQTEVLDAFIDLGVSEEKARRAAVALASRDDILVRIDTRLDRIDSRLDRMDDRFDRIDSRLDKMDERFDKVDSRLDKMDARFDKMDAKFDRLAETVVVNGRDIVVLKWGMSFIAAILLATATRVFLH